MTTRKTIAAAALFALNMAIACTITYAIITHVLAPFVDKSDDLLGGMWAMVATVFVFRDTRVHSVSAGVARLAATTLSIVLCLQYLLNFPFSGSGMAAVIRPWHARDHATGPAGRHHHDRDYDGGRLGGCEDQS